MKTLSHNTVIVVPDSRWEHGRLQELLGGITRLVGGLTITESSGYFVDAKGAIVEEYIVLVSINYNEEQGVELDRCVCKVVLHLLQQGEEAVMVHYRQGGQHATALYYDSDTDDLVKTIEGIRLAA